ncbi:hypothetical protein PPROV_000699700 [Pycnococcus provasolii]|uniref:Galactosyltransferase C-terminal domain-containing protein n=1 Tax=Pycnococcus provasolii TaxID=41880 RepID=A0A830HLH5_9CHLO|nr:hypothetical protein PPROV_000699700 [Pycnococcus provasolii]|mmetsp:Transcript_4779/g.12473  ORF Transcript_4779/g.12473 Transcript_4779/m.12473 type:complete len:416 (+) Transcript_4779:17-1264(+)
MRPASYGGPPQHVSAHLLVVVPYREDYSKTRHGQLLRFVNHFQHLSFEGLGLRDDLGGADLTVDLIVVEQSCDSLPFNRGQLLNVGYAYAIRENILPPPSLDISSESVSHTTSPGEQYFIAFHDVDLLPSPRTFLEYTKPFAKLGTENSNNAGSVRVVQAANSRYDGNACFGGVTIFDQLGFTKAHGWSNRYWGWGGEDNCLYARCVASGVNIQRVAEQEFQDLELDMLGIRTVEDKLRALDTTQRPTEEATTAKLAFSTKQRLIRSDRSKRGQTVWWPRDNWRTCETPNVVDVQSLGMRAVKITVQLTAFRPTLPAQCSACGEWKDEGSFSAAQFLNFNGGTTRGPVRGTPAAQCVPQAGEAGYARCAACVAADPLTTHSKASKCENCGAEFSSRTKLFKHLEACNPPDIVAAP